MTRADKLLLLLLCGACMAGRMSGDPHRRASRNRGARRRHGGFRECGRDSRRRAFRLPDVPEALRDPADRRTIWPCTIGTVSTSADTALLSCPEITEQAFVDFLSVLPHAREAAAAVDTLYSRAAVRSEALYCFIGLGDKYLYEPNSPMCDEELYILVLRALTANPRIGEADKLRPRRPAGDGVEESPGRQGGRFRVSGPRRSETAHVASEGGIYAAVLLRSFLRRMRAG